VTNGVSSFANGEEIGGPGSLWADEEDKKFYEELRELKGEVPGSVLGIKIEKEKVDEIVVPLVEEVVGEAEVDERAGVEELADSATPSTDPLLAAGPAAKLSALFARLNDASSRSMIDNIAIEFAFLNSKAARKRLVKVCATLRCQIFLFCH
jgi:regulator of nonsense transcripts 2